MKTRLSPERSDGLAQQFIGPAIACLAIVLCAYQNFPIRAELLSASFIFLFLSVISNRPKSSTAALGRRKTASRAYHHSISDAAG
ncbi:MAG: hypothetical protein KIS77_05920 [Saprospiraceae bacterium]|nr:hypothetical protein [Saprospiraceae bacterium]